MESSRLHPLLIVTAVSLTAFSATGIGVLTGVISSPRNAPEAMEQPLPAVRNLARPVEAAEPGPVAPAIEQPALRQPAPAPKPRLHRPVVRAAAPAQAEPVVFREFNEPPAAAPLPPVAQLPAAPPAPAGIAGVVESVREVKSKGPAGGAGAILGGILGAVVGSAFSDGRKAATVLAAAGGALAGHHIEKDATGTRRWEISVRLDDGTRQVLSSDVAPFWSAGDRVRFLDGRLQPV